MRAFDPDHFSHDLTEMVLPCPRCQNPMHRHGETIRCKVCGAFTITNRSAQLFASLPIGTEFVSPPNPEIVFVKTGYDYDKENAKMTKGGGGITFDPNDVVIQAHFRLIAGFFSIN